jgi:hypothetical protein
MATYTGGIGDLIYTGATAVTEDLSRVNGFIAGCGQAALLVVLNAVKGQSTTPSDVTSLIKQAVSSNQVTGKLASSGESSPANLEALAQANGVTLQSGNYQSLLAQFAGIKPILLGVSNAHAFGGSDTGVGGHYVTVVGKTSKGNYIVSDPNTAESQAGKFVTYTPAQITASQPFWSAVPSGVVTGAATGIGGSLLNLQLPSWVNDLGTRFTAFVDQFGSWANPLRLFKFLLGSFILIGVVIVILTYGYVQIGRAGERTAGKIIQPAAKALTTAGNIIGAGD